MKHGSCSNQCCLTKRKFDLVALGPRTVRLSVGFYGYCALVLPGVTCRRSWARGSPFTCGFADGSWMAPGQRSWKRCKSGSTTKARWMTNCGVSTVQSIEEHAPPEAPQKK